MRRKIKGKETRKGQAIGVAILFYFTFLLINPHPNNFFHCFSDTWVWVFLSEKSKKRLGSGSKFSKEITHFVYVSFSALDCLTLAIRVSLLVPPQARRIPSTEKIFFLCLRRQRRVKVPFLLVKELYLEVTSMLWWDIWGWPILGTNSIYFKQETIRGR